MRGKKELAACICVTKKYDTRFLLSIIQLNFDSTCIEMNFQILYGLFIKLGQKIRRFLQLGKGERLQFLQVDVHCPVLGVIVPIRMPDCPFSYTQILAYGQYPNLLL